jgi:hypothetical protein
MACVSMMLQTLHAMRHKHLIAAHAPCVPLLLLLQA